MSTDNSDATATSSFLADYGSHIAAIVVGVVVTLAVVQSMTKNGGNGTARVAVETNSKKKKRNKKKGKGNGGGEIAAGTSPATPASNGGAKSSNGLASAATESKAVKISEPIAPVTIDKVATAPTGKKKKKKNGSADTASTAPATNGKSNGVQSETDRSASVPAVASITQPKPTSFYDYDPRQVRQEEEVWETIPDNKSKKKNKGAQKMGAGAAKVSSSSTTSPTTASEVVSIDAKKVGIIIGPKGATMTAISAATGCKLDVNAPPKDVKPNTRSAKPLQATVVISEGTSESIAKAKQAVLELAASGYATLLQADTFGEQSLSVHPKVLSQIVGPGGRTIQAIQTALNVKITIPKTDWKPNAPQFGNVQPTCKVGIAGDDRSKVREAKRVLQQLLQYHYTEITHPGMIHQEVYVPQEFYHCVIGLRGAEIKHIKGNYKVEVYMPTSDGPTENVLVVGQQSNVEKAIRYIELLIERDTEQRAQKYSDDYYG